MCIEPILSTFVTDTERPEFPRPLFKLRLTEEARGKVGLNPFLNDWLYDGTILRTLRGCNGKNERLEVFNFVVKFASHRQLEKVDQHSENSSHPAMPKDSYMTIQVALHMQGQGSHFGVLSCRLLQVKHHQLHSNR